MDLNDPFFPFYLKKKHGDKKMVYKAKINIGNYKSGEIVPDKQAKLWLSIYKCPPVELVSGDIKSIKKEEKKEEEVESFEEDNSNPLLDDYLNQNSYVVKKSLREDNLSGYQLKKLIEIEKADKNRKSVLKALFNKLEE